MAGLSPNGIDRRQDRRKFLPKNGRSPRRQPLRNRIGGGVLQSNQPFHDGVAAQ